MNKKINPPKKILVTAGPTIEPLDPVRYISNYSTGTMGYEIAAQAAKEGYAVCLVSGPVSLSVPSGVEVVNVKEAREMRTRVIERIDEYDCLIMAAAVCDFRPENKKKSKIKKKKELTLKLVKNPDILMELTKNKGLIKIGFALETNNPIKNGKNKLKEKKLDLIVLNTISKKQSPFGSGRMEYTIIHSSGTVRHLKKRTKKQMAKIITKEAGKLMI